MNNSKSGLVGILSFIALTAASLGLLGAASRSASASQPAGRAPIAVVRDAAAPVVSFETVIDEVTVEGRVPAKRAAAKPAAVPAEPVMTCRVRALEQGPEAMTVTECHPAW